jgi:hypothetical protein
LLPGIERIEAKIITGKKRSSDCKLQLVAVPACISFCLWTLTITTRRVVTNPRCYLFGEFIEKHVKWTSGNHETYLVERDGQHRVITLKTVS